MFRFARYGNIVLFTLDRPPVNALSLPLQKELSRFLDRAEADPQIHAIVIAGSPRIFCAGGDLSEIQRFIAGAPDCDLQFIRTLFLLIENSSVPVVAALSGQVIGGGLELAMACHYRVAAPSARLSLPEVKLGIVPGAGGALRLPRLVGPAAAVEICAYGNPVSSQQALEYGLIDKIIKGDLVTNAIAFARDISGKPTPRTRERRDKIGAPAKNAPIFAAARESLRKQHGNLPAPLLAVDLVEAATSMSFEEAWQFENATSAKCMASPQARALIHLFLAERELRNIPDLPQKIPAPPVKTAGVIGAGTMGGGIAMALANAGILVLLKDANKAALDRGFDAICKNYESLVLKSKITQQEMEERLALIKPTPNWSGFNKADIVIEAVFEDLSLKQGIFAELDKICKPGAILASNTSTLSIDKIAAATSRPESVIGTHFFIPPPIMGIVEIVRGQATGKETITAVMQLTTKLGKLGALVRDCRGFVANRMAERYRIQASFLVEEGAKVETVDWVLVDFGMTIGPLAVGDIAGLDIIRAGRASVREAEIKAGLRQPVEDRLCDLKRYGRKTGAGWYRYNKNRRGVPDPELEELIRQWATDSGVTQRSIANEEIVERCIYMLINEGARILEEGIALRASDIDVIFVKAYGFPAWRGGPMWYADTVGLRKIHERICDFHRQHGPVWEPAPLLKQLAESGGSFYPADLAASLL